MAKPNKHSEMEGIISRRIWAGEESFVLDGGSSNGRHAVYTDWGTANLALRDLTTGNKRYLTHNGSWESLEYPQRPVISPDGNQVVYAWFNGKFYELRVVSVDGAEPRVLYRNEEVEYAEPAAWSRDGRQVLAAFNRKDKTNQIVLVSIPDGKARVIKSIGWRWPERMSLSPDARYVVYDFPQDERSLQRDVHLLAADGSQEVPLVRHPADDLWPFWTPDGTSVLFFSDRATALSLWGIPVSEGKAVGEPRLVRPDMGQLFPLGFNDRGTFFYGLFTGMNAIHIAKVDFKTGQFLLGPSPLHQGRKRSVGSPEWSPDGLYLADRLEPGPGPGGSAPVIVIRSLKTGKARELIPELNSLRSSVRWSPDGKSFVAFGQDKTNRYGVYRIDAETGSAVPIMLQPADTSFTACAEPSWSADGKAIFCARYEGAGGFSIQMRDLTTGLEKELHREVSSGYGVSLLATADGRWVAFRAADSAGKPGKLLMVVPVEGGQARELYRAEDSSHVVLRSWTADSREILFSVVPIKKDSRDEFEIWKVAVEGGKATKLALNIENLSQLRLHPDG
ncbi:MAG: hypothetical protein L0312_08515, partial [Acidobacteria bacterium]|nr:hypothetical protein [Acidobacteriota bacterium]